VQVRIQLYIPGDINNDRKINLADAVLVLQVSAGMVPFSTVYKEADVNGDGKIGVEEAIYLMQKTSNIRQ